MYIHIKAFTGQKKEEVLERKPGYFDVFVREKPEQNQANRKIIELIALHFKVPNSSVRMVSGHQKPSKILSINPAP
jgi:uncharacterized protein YggU (UPF0235/DUF167 family)